MYFFKVALVAVVMTVPALVGAAETKSNDEFIELQQIGSGIDGVDAAVKRATDSAARFCARSKQSALIERFQAGPSARSIDDAVVLRYRCVAADDPALAAPGRDAARADAGRGLIERAAKRNERGPFGWDMTYGSVFDAASVVRNDTTRKYFRDSWHGAEYLYETQPNEALFSDLNTAANNAAVLLDFRSPLYGNRVMWLAYTAGDKAEWRRWQSHQKRDGGGETRGVETERLNPAVARRLAQELMSFQVSVPKGPPVPAQVGVYGRADLFVYSGYVGVASVLLDGRVRQFPIAMDDLLKQDVATGQPMAGRLMRFIELAALPPAERAKEIESDRRREAAVPLLEAAATGDLARIAQLLDAGANVNTEIDNTTPLIAAVKAKQLAAVQLLLARKANPNHHAKSSEHALPFAAILRATGHRARAG
jgi:hypothetical protein